MLLSKLTRGAFIINCEKSNILIADDSEVTFYADFIQSEAESPSQTFKRLFSDLAVILSNTEVENWFNDDSEEDIETIKFYLTKTIRG